MRRGREGGRAPGMGVERRVQREEGNPFIAPESR